MVDIGFEHEETETGGSKRPTKVRLKAMHPEHGQVGWLDYHVPRRKADKIYIDRLEVDPDHRGNGYASRLMDEMQRRHPGTPIDHGDRTDDGAAWWSGYTRDKRVTKGRTMASRKTAGDDWKFEHFPVGGTSWRTLGGPSDDPRKHMVDYRVTEPGKVKFDGSFTPDRIRERHGDEDADRMVKGVLDHHGATEQGPEPEPEPERPKRRVYYHGTTVEDVTHVLPASAHGGHVTFPHVTSREHAYATTDQHDAWEYAQKAWAASGKGRPRVYQVRPIGGHQHVEKDPSHDQYGNSRGNNENDVRSKKGFEVVREVKWPKHMGDPEEWE